jgi:predicted 3-demethylubiquinone-9 3-methyltransferase (glyoxalase superfamily)
MGKNLIENLLFQFDSPEAADHFWRWFQESGEQQYWEYMSYREADEEGDITGLEFRKEKNGAIKVKCGRFTDGAGQ